MKGWMLAGALALGTLAAPSAGQAVKLNPDDTSGLRKVGAEVLFWSQAQRDANVGVHVSERAGGGKDDSFAAVWCHQLPALPSRFAEQMANGRRAQHHPCQVIR